MSLRRASAVAAAAVVAMIAGCATANPIDDVREHFVAAGGECATWINIDEPRALAAIRCSEGAILYAVSGDAERADIVKTELETNTNIRGRTHIILSGENWLIIDRIAAIVTVMPSLHGIIQGRNGANP